MMVCTMVVDDEKPNESILLKGMPKHETVVGNHVPLGKDFPDYCTWAFREQ